MGSVQLFRVREMELPEQYLCAETDEDSEQSECGARNIDDFAGNLPKENCVFSTESQAPEENVLGNRNAFSDVILEVEGKELYANRAVLAHYSPVFNVMFTAGFKEKSAPKVPLPGKDYSTVVTFYNVLFPRSASAKCLINDDNLIPLLTLADEYQTDEVKAKCQSYIGDQLLTYFRNSYRSQNQDLVQRSQTIKSATANPGFAFGRYETACSDTFHSQHQSSTRAVPASFPGQSIYPSQHQSPTVAVPATLPGQNITKKAMIDKLILYLWGCYGYELPAYRDMILSLIVDICTCLHDARLSKHNGCLPLLGKVDLLEALCFKFDGTTA